MHFSKIAAIIAASAASVSAAPRMPAVALSTTRGVDSCGNAGINYKIWIHGSPDNAVKPEDWDPATLESKGKPDFEGRRGAIGTGDTSFSGFADGHQGTIYDNGPMLTGHVAIKHDGYIYAYLPGDYTFTLEATDDATYLYAGRDCSSARKGKAFFSSQKLGEGTNSKKITVEQGYYIPFQVRWANVMRGPYNFQLTVTGPDGQVMLNKAGSKNVVSRICRPRNAKIWSASGLQ